MEDPDQTTRTDGARVVRARDEVRFDPDRFTPTPVAGSDRMTAMLVSLLPGQQIPEHAPGIDVVLTILQGHAQVTHGEEETDVSSGDVVFVPADVVRAVYAYTPLVALHVVSPPPSQGEHRMVEQALAGDPGT